MVGEMIMGGPPILGLDSLNVVRNDDRLGLVRLERPNHLPQPAHKPLLLSSLGRIPDVQPLLEGRDHL